MFGWLIGAFVRYSALPTTGTNFSLRSSPKGQVSSSNRRIAVGQRLLIDHGHPFRRQQRHRIVPTAVVGEYLDGKQFRFSRPPVRVTGLEGSLWAPMTYDNHDH